MKKLLLILSCLSLFGGIVYATPSVWLSSYTITADTTQNLCKPQTVGQIAHADWHGVCIDSGSASDTFSMYASSGSANNTLATINATSTLGCYYYDVEVSSGLTYSKTGTSAVTILYQCY